MHAAQVEKTGGQQNAVVPRKIFGRSPLFET